MPFYVRKAELTDLEKLVSFAISEALEAEGITKEPERVRGGIRAALNDDTLALDWVLEGENSEVIGNVSVFRDET